MMIRRISVSFFRETTAALVLAVWLCLAILFMLLARHLDLEIYFVLFLIGLLVITELADARYLSTPERRRLRYLIGGGVLLFGIIVAGRVVEIVTS